MPRFRAAKANPAGTVTRDTAATWFRARLPVRARISAFMSRLLSISMAPAKPSTTRAWTFPSNSRSSQASSPTKSSFTLAASSTW